MSTVRFAFQDEFKSAGEWEQTRALPLTTNYLFNVVNEHREAALKTPFSLTEPFQFISFHKFRGELAEGERERQREGDKMTVADG